MTDRSANVNLDRKTLMLMLAAYESDKLGKPVEMDYSL